MRVINKSDDLLKIIESNKKYREKISIIPTMGNLHPGHLSLIEKCKSRQSKVIVTIFINPLQFNDKNDFRNYPQSYDQDLKKLSDKEVDYVFVPDSDEILSEIPDVNSLPWGFSNLLCGKSRKNHFIGVFKIIKRLFDLIQPDYAFFGEKDYQQCLLIKYMAQESHMLNSTMITVCPTIRDNNGLPLSSRNSNLNTEDKIEAAKMFSSIKDTVSAYFKSTGLRNFYKLLPKTSKVKFDYVELYSEKFLYEKHGLQYPNHSEKITYRIFIAFTMSNVRLIDNYIIEEYDTV